MMNPREIADRLFPPIYTATNASHDEVAFDRAWAQLCIYFNGDLAEALLPQVLALMEDQSRPYAARLNEALWMVRGGLSLLDDTVEIPDGW